jgi:integrase
MRLPAVRSDEDCRRLIAALERPILRGCFALMYAYGLRIAEALYGER